MSLPILEGSFLHGELTQGLSVSLPNDKDHVILQGISKGFRVLDHFFTVGKALGVSLSNDKEHVILQGIKALTYELHVTV